MVPQAVTQRHGVVGMRYAGPVARERPNACHPSVGSRVRGQPGRRPYARRQPAGGRPVLLQLMVASCAVRQGSGRRRCRYGAVSITTSWGQSPSSWQSLSQARQPPQRPETRPQRIRDTNAPLGHRARRSAGWAFNGPRRGQRGARGFSVLACFTRIVPLRRHGARTGPLWCNVPQSTGCDDHGSDYDQNIRQNLPCKRYG